MIECENLVKIYKTKDIEVLASDNTKSAVSGIEYSEFVIISSQKPLDNGQQVRLAEN